MESDLKMVSIGRDDKYKDSSFKQFNEENGHHPYGCDYLFMKHSQVTSGSIPRNVADSDLDWFRRHNERNGLNNVWVPDSYDRLTAAVTHNFNEPPLKEIVLEKVTPVKACIRSPADVLSNIARTPIILFRCCAV